MDVCLPVLLIRQLQRHVGVFVYHEVHEDHEVFSNLIEILSVVDLSQDGVVIEP